jgi:PilY1 beta-propeller domain/FG-GAP-like repeat
MKEAEMRKFLFGLTVFSALAAMFLVTASGQLCEEQSGQAIGYVGGNASTVAAMDGVANDTARLVLRLKNKGGNFVLTSNYPVTANSRVTSAAADFNGDGFVDLVLGGKECDNNANGADTNLSIIISQGRDPGDPLRFLFSAPYYVEYLTYFTTYEIMACGAGDYDGDGDSDISVLSWQGRLWVFNNLYVENGRSPGDVPDFDPQPTLIADVINDGYGEFGSAVDHWRWESNIESVDIDNDYDLDLIVGIPSRWAWNRWGEVVIYINTGNGAFSRIPQVINPYNNTAAYIYGVCGVAAADFDGDGDVDFFAGSANSSRIYYYRNNAGTFNQVNSKTITIPNNCGSCASLSQGDLGNDGDCDLVLVTDGTTNAPGGYVYWLANDGAANFTLNPIPSSGAQVSPSGDLDFGSSGDFDGDDDLDIFIADGSLASSCYFFTNDIFPTYVPTGTAYSKNLVPCSFINSDNAIVSATIQVQESKPSRTDIQYYLSNNDDENGNPLWEGPVTAGVEWDFENPGDFLRWRAVFTTSDETVTPTISSITIDYKYIGKREYSRTSQAVSMAEVDASHTGDEEVLYSASFEYPKWNGHLRSWNVTDLNLTYNRGSQLQEIRDAGAEFVADAGDILSTRDWSTRVVYTAYDAQSDGIMNDRLDFNTVNAAILDDYLGLGLGSPEVNPLIRFVLGEGRSWKLGDINHSSPQALNPPSGNPTQMGSGYDSFKEALKDRRRVILAGANDGMLHCFDARTMVELWAFIPNNLLSKLRRMKVIDPDCGEFLYHHFFVDGTPAIQDVYFGTGWHTILVCGQGAGWGKDHKWYYFALDVTNPESPQPLWEFTDSYMGETWAVPAIGKIDTLDTWIAFFGSGYDSDGDPGTNIGNYFYALDVGTGQALRSFEIRENSEPTSPYGIQNTLPGSPEIADKEADGYIDAVYFGDLIGRIWKIDLTEAPAGWTPEVIYRDPYRFPIITKPAIFVNLVDNVVHLYFGTGGDEKSPNVATYSFISLTDGTTPFVEWYLGADDLATQLRINIAAKKGEFVPGERVWADPVIVDRVVFIATLEGSIESINPCRTLVGRGRIYGRYVLGNQVGGSSILNESGGPINFLETKQKVRSAVTVGETQLVSEEGQVGINKRKVYIQSYTQPGEGGPEPPSQVLAQPAPQTALVIRQWREVYKVYKR